MLYSQSWLSSGTKSMSARIGFIGLYERDCSCRPRIGCTLPHKGCQPMADPQVLILKVDGSRGAHLYTTMPGSAEMGYLSVISRHQIHGFHCEAGPGCSGPSLHTWLTSDAQIFSLQDNVVGLGFTTRCYCYLIGQHMVHMFHCGAGPGCCLPAMCTWLTPDMETFSVHDNM